MEDQVLAALAATLATDAAVRNDAERHLTDLSTNEVFPISLISIASHTSVPKDLRQSALLSLKRLVLEGWSPSIEEYEDKNPVAESLKDQIRHSLFSLATSGDGEAKVVRAASDVLSRIASADFPDQWPNLLSNLLQIIQQGDTAQLHDTLVVLNSLVEDGFDEEQFSGSAVDLVKALYDVSVDDGKKLTSRALAISIFRACFDTMELVFQTNKTAVKQFMQDASDAWTPFFLGVLKMPLPKMPTTEEEEEGGEVVKVWRGVVALKTQVAKALDKIQNLFPQLLGPHLPELFGAVWESLKVHLGPYITMYVDGEHQGRMEDADGLQYTIDFLVMEEIDLISTMISDKNVRRELESQLSTGTNTNGGAWFAEAMQVLVGYSQITQDDEGMWEIDVNIFLAEETAETSNYSTRSACSNLVVKLCGWSGPVVQSLLDFSKTVYTTGNQKMKEATLFILKQILDDFHTSNNALELEAARVFLGQIRNSIQDSNADQFLKARSFVLAGALVTGPGEQFMDVLPDLTQLTLNELDTSVFEVVKVSCLRVLQEYMKSLPASQAPEFQKQVVAAIAKYITNLDLEELKESGDDLLDTLVETLRDAIMAAPEHCLDHPALDILFTLASQGANSFATTMLVNEAFESITSAMSSLGLESYTKLCTKVLPTLTGALDVAGMTDQAALSDMAIQLLAILADQGPSPLPQGFVATVMPKLYRIIFSNADFNVHQSATLTIKHLLEHDFEQVFTWQDPDTGKTGLETILFVVDRLLGPGVEDASAAEVGGLAVELVEKAGADKLGAYLIQLLQIIAIRLSTATHPSTIQNLVMVFARLSIGNAQDIIDFLSQIQIHEPIPGSGLEIVLRKWLENCVTFAGYDDVRQNIMALTNMYNLHDERLMNIAVQGDLVQTSSTRIKTRSLAKKEPDQFEVISIPVKLIKVLIGEMSPPPNSAGFSSKKSVVDGHVSDNGEEDEWEDESNFLDLGSPSTRNDLMGLMDESRYNYRCADDETNKYLVHFFHSIENDPLFQSLYHSLNDAERDKLQNMDQLL